MRAFTGSLLLPYYLGLSPCFVETWVWRRGENFSMTEINTVSSYSSIPFPFCFSLSIVIPSCPLLHNTAPSCLHIARSNAANCSFTACSFDAFPSHHSIPTFTGAFPPLTCGAMMASRWAHKNKMQLKALKRHKSFYCWQGGGVSKSHHCQTGCFIGLISIFWLSRTPCFRSINLCMLPLKQRMSSVPFLWVSSTRIRSSNSVYLLG